MDSLLFCPDQDLIALLKEGNRLAFAQIFERYHDLLLNHAYNKLRNKDESNDVIQDVFLKLWDTREDINIQNLSAYLYTMVRNKIFSVLQHKEIINDYSNSFDHFRNSDYIPTDHLVREKQLSEIINREIAALPPRMREIFELSRRDYLSNKQIAEKLGLSEHTVADQIKKALRQLRSKVGGTAFLFFLLLNRWQ